MARHFVASSSQYLERLGVPVTDVPLTLSIWVKTGSTPGLYAGALCNTATSGWYLIGGTATSARAYEFDGTTAAIAETPIAIPANSWTHLCAVFAARGARSVYLNGSAKITNAAVTTAPALDRTMVAAGYFGGSLFSSFWDGDLAEFAIWKTALGDAEVAQLSAGYQATQIQIGNLVAYYPLLGVAAPEPDTMGGVGLNLVNGPTPAPHPPIIGLGGAGRMFQVF